MDVSNSPIMGYEFFSDCVKDSKFNYGLDDFDIQVY